MAHELSETVERDGKHFIESTVQPGKVLEGPFGSEAEASTQAMARSEEFDLIMSGVREMLGTEEENLIEAPETDLIKAPASSPQFLPETTRFLSLLAQATQDTFESLALPVSFDKLITSKGGEKQVRNAFAAQSLLEGQNLLNDVALEALINGATPQDVEAILGGKPFSQGIKEVSDNVLEIEGAKWLVDHGLASEERATRIMNEEFSPEGVAEVSRTDKQQDFITTMLKLRGLANKLTEEIGDDSILQNTIDIMALTLVPFFTSAANFETKGRGVEQLGDSIVDFNKKFWALPLDERLAMLTKFGEDLENGTVVGGNPFAAAVQLQQILEFTDEDKLGVNAIEAVDVLITANLATRVAKATGKLFNLFKAFKSISVMSRAAGYKDATAGRAVQLLQRERKGKALTVIEEDELIENLLPSMAAPVPGGEKGIGPAFQAIEKMDLTEAYEKILPDLLKQLTNAGVDTDLVSTGPVDLIALLRRTLVPEILKETEQEAANIAAIKSILKRAGVDTRMRAIVDPEKFTGGAISTKVYPVYDVDIDDISGIRTVNVFLGTGEGLTKGFTSAEAAEAGAARLGISKGFFEVSENTGEFFIKVSRNPGTTQYISPIDPSEIPKTVPVLTRALAGKAPSSTLDDLKGSRLSESAETILMQGLVKAVAAINPRIGRGPGLSRPAKKIYDEFMLEIQHTEKWKTGGQMAEWYQKHHQRVPTKREIEAYAATRQIYALDYLIRNNKVKNELIAGGWQEGMVRGLMNSPIIMKEVTGTSLPPRQVKIFDSVEKKFVQVRDGEELTRFLSRTEDLVLVKNLTRSKNFGDYIIAPKQDVDIRALRANVLNKIDGPHRIYDGDIFIKQQRIRNIAGVETIVHPKTHFVVKGLSEGKRFTEAYNEALNAFKVARLSDSALDKALASEFISKNTIFSGFAEMEKALEEGRLELTPFEVLKSGERPTFRIEEVGPKALDPDMLDFSDEVGEMIQNGRLYYSSRGPHLLNPDGNKAPLLHPDQILAMSSRNAIGTQSYNNYKVRQVNRWVKTYEKYLVPQPGWGVDKMFMLGTFDKSQTAPIRISNATLRAAELQRRGIKQLLKNRGVIAETISRFRDQIIDIIDDRANANVADRVANLMSNDPIVFLRGAAFKAFLGSDISQLIVQTSMTPGVIAIAPVEAGKSIAMYGAMRALLHNPQHIPFVGKLVEKSGIMKAEEFTWMMDDLDRSGAGIIGRNLSEIDGMTGEGGITSLGGALIRRGTDATMILFNEAERFVRVLGYTIAWQEHFTKTGKRPTSVDDLAGIMVRGIALAGNMTRAEKAWWQEGVFGLATQFVAQPFRMAELIGFGISDVKGSFSKKDKIRMYIGLALATGPTLGLSGDQGPTGSVTELIKQKYFEYNGTEIDETTLRFITAGMLGVLLPDTDISRLQVFGQGTLLSEFFDSEKGIDIWHAVGASGSMVSTFYNATIGSAKLWAFMNGNIDADLIPLGLMDIANDIGKTLVGYNRIQKAIHSYQTGEFISNSGAFLQRDVDHFDAFMIGLGLPPLASSEARSAAAFLAHYEDKVRKDAAQAAIFLKRSAAAEAGSKEERYNLALFAHLRDLNGGSGDLNGDGGALFANTVDSILGRDRTLTEAVRAKFNNVLRRDPDNLNTDRE